MAKGADKQKGADDAGGKKKPSLIGVIVSVALVTLIAGGGGFAFGTMLLGPKPPEEAAAPAEGGHEGEAKPAAEGEHASAPEPGRIVHRLAPIVTNLQSPKEAWIRLELALVLKPEASAEQDIIAVEAGDKVLGLLRTIALSQIDGPSGLLHLREDLTDLLVGGHDSMIQQVLISSMVVE